MDADNLRWEGEPLCERNQPRGREMQFGQVAILRYSSTPTLRSQGIEDEDDDEHEDDFDARCEKGVRLEMRPSMPRNILVQNAFDLSDGFRVRYQIVPCWNDLL
jgi:hypothetical protein